VDTLRLLKRNSNSSIAGEQAYWIKYRPREDEEEEEEIR